MKAAYKTTPEYKTLSPTTKRAISREVSQAPAALLHQVKEHECARIIAAFREDVGTLIGKDSALRADADARASLLDWITEEVFSFEAVSIHHRIKTASDEINASTPCPREDNIVGRVVVIDADYLAPAYRFEDRRFRVSGGLGSEANARGNALFGVWLRDNLESRVERYMVAGYAENEPAMDEKSKEQWREGWREQGAKDRREGKNRKVELRGKPAGIPYSEGYNAYNKEPVTPTGPLVVPVPPIEPVPMMRIISAAQAKFGCVDAISATDNRMFILLILRDDPANPAVPYMTISAHLYQRTDGQQVAFEYGHYDLNKAQARESFTSRSY